VTSSPFNDPENGKPYTVPEGKECPQCKTREAKIFHNVNGSGQDVVRCAWCGQYRYCASRKETGKPTPRPQKRPTFWVPDTDQKARIRIRDRGVCVMCRTTEGPFEIGHLIPVKICEQYPSLAEAGRSDANLALTCRTCNSDLSARPVSLLWMAALHMEQERHRDDL